jgi:hypothetical protein
MSELKIDLVKDWQDQILSAMKSEGLNNTRKMKIDQLIISYFTYLRKKELGLKHRIHYAKEFFCPEKYKPSLCNIIDILKTGGDIGPYLSTGAIAFKNDYMFNNWGIVHLHLGDEPHKRDRRFIKRTGLLLFMYRHDNDAYLINTSEHNRWSNLENLQILENNWQELIENRKLYGITGLSDVISDTERFNFWKKGMDTVTELKDQKGEPMIIAPPGDGSVASGDSVKDVLLYMEQEKKLKNLEKAITCDLELIKLKMKDENIQPADNLEFKLVKADSTWYIVEKNGNWILT